MFTGLIEDVGTVESISSDAGGARLRIATHLGAEIGPGDSVAVDGVCLTATGADRDGFETEAMNQTLAVSSLAFLEVGGRVNLELAVRASDRLGGHIVQGHVDALAAVISVSEDGFARRLRVAVDRALIRSVVEKGSLALNGVSLTVAALGEDWIEVSLIPETLRAHQPRRSREPRGPQPRVRHRCQVRAAPGVTIGCKGASVSAISKEAKTVASKVGTKVSPFSSVEEAIEEIRRGRMVVVCDDETRENEGDLTMAAQFATPEAINFMAKEARGLICLSLTRRTLRGAGAEPDGGQERSAASDRLYRCG